jgi:hypothetical protein
MVPLKTGPLTAADLLDIWKGAVDKGYSEPILAAGEGQGLEAFTQAQAQLARVSLAIDRTTQAMFILPSSGQTNPPASGGRYAQVTLTFQRNTRYVERVMVLGAGQIFVEEEVTDWGFNGGETVQTGRRYKLKENLVFHPGDIGPYDVEAEAEEFGDGHNNPRPGTITLITQVGAAFENDRASVNIFPGTIDTAFLLVRAASAIVTTPNQADTFVPDHVGQYMVFTAGSNAGKIGRIVQFFGPDLTVLPVVGSRVALEWANAVEGTIVGTFTAGERITRGSTTLYGQLLGARGNRLTYVFLASNGTDIAVGDVLTGTSSGATITVTSVLSGQEYVAESGTAAWRILDWASSWQLTATNAASPAGGVHPWLDELGFERNFQRASGEDDSTYRQRISAIADVVTPNAIRRTLSRTLGNIPWCFREVGTEYLPGFFFDGDRSPPSTTPHGAMNDPYDLDVVGVVVSAGFYAFATQEPVVVEDPTTGFPYVTGYYGRIAAGFALKVIRKTGKLPAIVAGLRVRGLESGQTANILSATPNTALLTRQYKVFLDYSQFRGFFQVCLPQLGLGEFGFAYDVGASNAYDLTTPWNTFFDGYPYRNALVYGKVFQALNEARAGGVLIALCQSDGPCP